MPTVFPYVPQQITVHLGAPSAYAANVTVPFTDYVKNVASSEIYPTWEESALRANILAIVSYALNRVYTEFYRSRGYDFDITNNTAYDQAFVNGRSFFENISRLVDELFNDFLRRPGFVEPLAAKFCNGTTVTGEGLSQWGSQNLARQGYNSTQILRNYYGRVEIVNDASIRGITSSYPGTPLRRGSSGPNVVVVQVELNRIAQNIQRSQSLPRWMASSAAGQRPPSDRSSRSSVFPPTASLEKPPGMPWYDSIPPLLPCPNCEARGSNSIPSPGPIPAVFNRAIPDRKCGTCSICFLFCQPTSPRSRPSPLTAFMAALPKAPFFPPSAGLVCRRQEPWMIRHGTGSTTSSPALKTDPFAVREAFLIRKPPAAL